MKEKIKNNLHYFIAPLIVLITFIIIMLVKGIFPFGNNIIADLNMQSIYMPAYYKLYDVLHGTASIFYDYNLGSGTSPFAILVTNGLLSPLSWIIYFTSRSNIPQFMSLIVIIKLLFISFTTYYSLNKIFHNVDKLYTTLFSVIYALSGYIILMYSNIIWLESIALFPLMILGLKYIFENKKSKIFMLSLFFSLIFNYQITLMILPFIFIITALGLLLFNPKNKKMIVTKVLIYVVMAFIFSSFALLPCLNSIINSYSLPININSSFLFDKIIYFFPAAILIFYFIKQILNIKKDKKYTTFYLILFFISSIGIIIPNISESLNNSFYSVFPFKYGFIPIYILILCSMHYLNINKEKEDKKNSKKFLITYILLNILLIYVVNVFKYITIDSNLSLNIDYIKQFIALMIIFIINFIIIVIVVKLPKNIKKYLLIFSTCISIIIFGYFTINVSNVSSAINADNVSESIKELSNNIYRIKDNTLSLGTNYSEFLNIPTNSLSINNISEQQYKHFYRLGYLTDATDIYSSGGTIFSDLLVGNKYILSYQKLPSDLYSLINEKNDVYYYESKYNLSFAIPYFGSTYNDYGDDIFNYQNNIYKKIFNKKDNIIEISKPSFELKNISVTSEDYYYPTNENNSIKFTVDVDELSNIYMNLNIKDGNIYNIIVNGKTLKNPTLTDLQNKNYPVSNQTTILLGQFSKGKVSVELKTSGVTIQNFEIGMININKFIDLVNENSNNISITTKMSTMKINYNNTEKIKSLLIPVNYSNNFKITNNGKEVPYTSNFNDYISLDLKDGINNIVITYKPEYFDLSIYIALIGVIIYNILAYINKRFNLYNNKLIGNISLFIFNVIILILIFKLYLLPLF